MITDERLAEIVGAGMPCVPIEPWEVAHVVQELRSLRAQGGATVGEAVALDGPELFEIIFGAFKGDVPKELTDAKLSEIAASINEAFALTAALSAPSPPRPGDKGHQTRLSDSSHYDEVCVLCGATDGRGDNRLDKPCPNALAAKGGQ